MTDIEKRLTFALIPGTADQPPTLVLGMTQAAFAAAGQPALDERQASFGIDGLDGDAP